MACARCGCTVCKAEDFIALNKVWHKCCFTCYKCGRRLEKCTAKIIQGELFCKCCYSEILENIELSYSSNIKPCKVVSSPSCLCESALEKPKKSNWLNNFQISFPLDKKTGCCKSAKSCSCLPDKKNISININRNKNGTCVIIPLPREVANYYNRNMTTKICCATKADFYDLNALKSGAQPKMRIKNILPKNTSCRSPERNSACAPSDKCCCPKPHPERCCCPKPSEKCKCCPQKCANCCPKRPLPCCPKVLPDRCGCRPPDARCCPDGNAADRRCCPDGNAADRRCCRDGNAAPERRCEPPPGACCCCHRGDGGCCCDRCCCRDRCRCPKCAPPPARCRCGANDAGGSRNTGCSCGKRSASPTKQQCCAPQCPPAPPRPFPDNTCQKCCRKLKPTPKYCACASPNPCDCKMQQVRDVCTACCVRCGCKVYAAEKIVVSSGAYHTSCFSCYCCNKSLDVVNVYEGCGEIYCKQCYNNLFGIQYYGRAQCC